MGHDDVPAADAWGVHRQCNGKQPIYPSVLAVRGEVQYCTNQYWQQFLDGVVCSSILWGLPPNSHMTNVSVEVRNVSAEVRNVSVEVLKCTACRLHGQG
jgi:hypothetical protein